MISRAVLFVVSVGISMGFTIRSSFSDQKSDSVAALIEQLVSPVDPPHENGFHPGMSSISNGIQTGFTHEQVAEAQASLVKMGPEIFPELVKHIADKRYSYSHVSAAWINYSVGTMIRRILAEDIEFCGWGYRIRGNPKGDNTMPTFDDYLDEIGVEKWAEEASKRTKVELRADFIKWYIGKESEFGFINQEQQKKYIDPCLVELEALKNGKLVPLSIIVSTTAMFRKGGSWHLSINSAGQAELTLFTYPKNKVRRFVVGQDFLQRVSEEVDKQEFFDLDSEYGEVVPDAPWTKLTIVRGVDSQSISFYFLQNWMTSAPDKLVEPSRGLRVLKVIRECFHDEDAVNLQNYYDSVIAAAKETEQ